MTKQAKILLILILAALLLVLYIIVTANKVTVKQTPINNTVKTATTTAINSAELVNDYTKNIKLIIGNYASLIGEVNSDYGTTTNATSTVNNIAGTSSTTPASSTAVSKTSSSTGPQSSIEKDIIAMENQLTAMKVPAQFRDLHLNLVLALNKLEAYLETGNISALHESKNMVNQIKGDYSWTSTTP